MRTRPANGLAKADYLNLMETAVSAYSDKRLASYLADVEKSGVKEHGFPRLAANLGLLVARGRLTEKRELLARMMTAACRDAAKGEMPPMSGGNEFSVKELAFAVAELERSGVYPKSRTDGWRKDLAAISAAKSYTTGCLPTGESRAYNWVVFAAASEQARLARGMGGDPAFVERHVADQLRWFDTNGMYKDPEQPMVYDLVTRLQFASILSDGYDGPSRGALEVLMDRSAEPTLKMLSASGEIPYGGRSNQFLHNHTFYAALCEWYAARYAKRGETDRAAAFRLAARTAIEALDPWLVAPVSHVKNRYPRETGRGVFSAVGDMGCERYAYFDKYMVTMGSWAALGWLFADESVPAADEDVSTHVFELSRAFHRVLMRAGDYSAQLDYDAEVKYDANGVGRVQRRGAPSAICLSTPCTWHPNYRIEGTNDAPLAIAPCGPGSFAYVGSRVEGDCAICESRSESAIWRMMLSSEGFRTTLEGNGPQSLELPAFAFDGAEETDVVCDGRKLVVTYGGWTCLYTTDGTILDTGRSACNRNGRYRRFRAKGQDHLSVTVKIVKSSARATETFRTF